MGDRGDGSVVRVLAALSKNPNSVLSTYTGLGSSLQPPVIPGPTECVTSVLHRHLHLRIYTYTETHTYTETYTDENA